MAAAGVAEKRGVGGHGQRVGRVKIGADAHAGKLVQIAQVGQGPCAARPKPQGVFAPDHRPPARLRGHKHPAAILPCGQVIGLARPGPRRGRSQCPDQPFGRHRGRGGRPRLFEHHLHQHIKMSDAFVMRHVLLCLIGHDIGQRQPGRDILHRQNFLDCGQNRDQPQIGPGQRQDVKNWLSKRETSVRWVLRGACALVADMRCHLSKNR